MNKELIYKEAWHLFGDDIGELVVNLLSLDSIQFSQDRIFLTPHPALNLTKLDEWLLSNVGLPEGLSPYLQFKLIYCEKLKKLILAEQVDNIIFLDDGKVFLQTNNSQELLNSNLINFLKMVILHQNMIGQAMLIFDVKVKVENRIPGFMKDYFIKMFTCFEKISPETWIKLAELKKDKTKKYLMDYAGATISLYGNTTEERQAYLKNERESWE